MWTQLHGQVGKHTRPQTSDANHDTQAYLEHQESKQERLFTAELSMQRPCPTAMQQLAALTSSETSAKLLMSHDSSLALYWVVPQGRTVWCEAGGYCPKACGAVFQVGKCLQVGKCFHQIDLCFWAVMNVQRLST
jgi:hypothetical protein